MASIYQLAAEFVDHLLCIYGQETFTSSYQKKRAESTLKQIGSKGGFAILPGGKGDGFIKVPCDDDFKFDLGALTVEIPEGESHDAYKQQLEKMIEAALRSMIEEPQVLVKTRHESGKVSYKLSVEWFEWFALTTLPGRVTEGNELLIVRSAGIHAKEQFFSSHGEKGQVDFKADHVQSLSEDIPVIFTLTTVTVLDE